MSGGSLRLRFFLAGAAAVAATLAVAALGLALLFERHVERRAAVELSARLDQLAVGLQTGPDGVALTQPPQDPRFERPLSGLYWQIRTPTGALRSRSLWDHALAPPPRAAADANLRELRLTGPRGEPLLVLERD